MPWFKFIVVAMLVGIVASLFTALHGLVRDGSGTQRTVRWLTVRIALSVSLIVLLLIASALGIITPHGIYH
ncbi:MAG: DUF2909 domain-containing protein [Gammaproteobacteria bacterium]